MAGTSWPTLTAGAIARASDVNAHFAWIEGDIVPQSGGSQTTGAYYLGTTGAMWLGVYTKSINPTSTANGVAIGTTAADAGSLLDIAGTKALIIPRLSSTQRDALTGRDGMIIFNTSTSQLQGFKNSQWSNVGGSVLQTRAATVTSVVNGTTVTVINIASGGGRLNALSVFAQNTNAQPRVTVVLDAVTVFSWTAATAAAYAYFVGPGTDVRRLEGTTAAVTVWETGVVTGTSSPFLGWDFASSCAVYIATAAAANATSTAQATLSVLV